MTLKATSMPMCTRKAKVILVPYPAQGHVTPMLKLASVLVHLDFQPVLTVPEFIHRRISSQIDPKDGILCISIPDGLDEETPRDFFAIEMAMENYMPFHLQTLVGELNDDQQDGEIACMVVDLLSSYAIDVAHRCGVHVAGFWPVMLAVYELIAAIPDMVRSGIISEAGFPLHEGPVRVLPDQPTINTEDLPWLIGTPAARNARFKFWTRTLNRAKTLHYLLGNSFPEECPGGQYYHHLMTDGVVLQDSQPLILPIGPLNNNLNSASKRASFWEEDLSCLEWLDKQANGSVVYVCFGSWVSPIGEAKVKSLAMALEASCRLFIWVLGHAWREGLPKGYVERVSKQGRIVSWAPQLEVLQHKAVGCYLTHCGWNSTIEAIQCKKCLLCYPVAGDQFLNCAYIVKTWRIGVKLGGFGQKDLEEGLKRVTEDDEMNRRIVRLNERIMGKDASSLAMNNLKKFVRDLKKSSVTTSTLQRTLISN